MYSRWKGKSGCAEKINQTVTKLTMEKSDSLKNESFNQSGSNSKQVHQSRPHQYRGRTRRKRTRSEDYLTARGHVQVDPVDKQQHNSRTKRKSLPGRKHVDISRVSPVTQHLSPNTRHNQHRIKEDYITASGHVQVDVVSPSQTRDHGSSSKKDEHILIELIDEDDLFQPMSNRIVESDFDDEIDEDDNYSVVYVDEEDVRVLDCVSPPQHTDVQLVPRNQSPAKILQHRQRHVEKAEYLGARGHVNVGRPKKKQKIDSPVVELIEHRLAPRRVTVLVLESDCEASPPLKQRSIKISPRVHLLIPNELNVSSLSPKVDVKSNSLDGTVTQSDMKMDNIEVQMTSVSRS